MISALGWFWIIYISIGIFVMMEAIVESRSWTEYPKSIWVIGSIVSVLVWPLIFFV